MKLRWVALLLLGFHRLEAAEPNSPPHPLAKALGQECLDGNLNRVVALVGQGAPVNEQFGTHHDIPLIAARNHADIVKYLLAHGADPNGTDKWGNTALVTGSYWHYPDSVLALLEAGANPNQPNKGGRLPLMNAAMHGYNDIVRSLLAYHADVNDNNAAGPALWRAAEKNHVGTLKILLDAGADLTRTADPVLPERRSWSLLTETVSDQCIPALDFLLDHGVDVNERAPDGRTALMEAVGDQQPRAVAELLKRGARVDLADGAGYTPIIIASGWFQKNVFHQIIGTHPDVNVQDRDGWTPLMYALAYGREPGWSTLVRHGAKLEAKDRKGRTALLQSCMRHNSRAVFFLVAHGADVNATDKDGNTALAYAGDRGEKKVVKFLRVHGAKQTEVHILPKEKPVPPLPGANAWALAAAAIYFQRNGMDPFILGGLDPQTLADQRRDLREDWGITNRATCRKQLQWLRTEGCRGDFQTRGVRLLHLNDAAFNAITTVLPTPDAKACRDSYKKWKKRSGLAWDLCCYINLVSLCYDAKYLTEVEAWKAIMPVARQLQKNFNSWRELSDNFLDGRTIANDGKCEETFEACAQLLLDPHETNSPWNQIPWNTDPSSP